MCRLWVLLTLPFMISCVHANDFGTLHKQFKVLCYAVSSQIKFQF